MRPATAGERSAILASARDGRCFVQRMTAMDAQFLYTDEEIPAAHAHTLKVSIYEPGPNGYSFGQTKELLAARMHRLPPFRWKMLPTPLGLHHPTWINDPTFDLDWHVRRVAVPSPGGTRELCELISEIASRPLDRTRPLWELWMVEGLEGGQVAAVAKVHHAVADGISSAELLNQYHDAEPTLETEPGPPWSPDQPPSKVTLFLTALVAVLRSLLTGLPEMVKAAKAAKQRRTIAGLAESEMPPKPFKAPTLRFNRVISPHRSYTIASVPLEDARRVRAAFGCTINDVFLAAVAGGLRTYLLDHDELPDRALVGSVPVSTRSEAEQGTWGNRLSKMYVHLRTDVADPIERLRAQQQAAASSKAEFGVTRGARLENWIEVMPLPLLRLLGRTFDRLKRVGGPSTENLIVSNVPGPKAALFAGDARMTAFYSVGPVAVGVGLNITVWSYVDQLNFSLIACRESVPDLWDLTDAVKDSVAELVKAADEAHAPQPVR